MQTIDALKLLGDQAANGRTFPVRPRYQSDQRILQAHRLFVTPGTGRVPITRSFICSNVATMQLWAIQEGLKDDDHNTLES